ncbi:MAG: Ig-like domain repeat protein, partial [Rhodoglobus sp.]
MFARAFRDVGRFYGRSWWFVALVQLVAGLIVAIPLSLVTQAANLVVAGQGQALAATGNLSTFTVVFLLVAIVVCLPLGLVGLSATVRIVIDSLASRGRRFWAPFAEGFRHIPALAAAASITIAGTVLLVVLSPVFTALGLVALLLTPVVRLVRRRRDGFLSRWPDLVTLAWAIAPFGFALRFIAGAMFFAPAIVLENLGPIAAMRAGAEVARPRRLRLVGFVVACVLASIVLQMGASWLGSFLEAAGSLTAQVLLQVFLVALPAVLVTVLFRLGRSTSTDGSLPASRTVPYATADSALPPRRRRVTTTAPVLVRRVAILMPLVVVIAGIGLAPTAASADPAALTLTVTTAADTTDDATLALQAANCATGSGECSLRAAARAAVTASTSGVNGVIAIVFADSYTIALAGAPIDLASVGAASVGEGGEGGESGGEGGESGGEGGGESGPGTSGTIVIDGSGHTIVLDGQNATQVLKFQSNAWGLQLSHVQISRGAVSGADALGGGVSIISSSASYIDSVTFDGNQAQVGGGAVSTAYGQLSIVNSTFANNSGGTLGSSDYLLGGADVYALYGAQVAINNSTFAGYSGGSILNWAAAGGTATTLSNSLFDLRGGTSVVACTGGGITGLSNVVSGDDTSCGPDTISNASPALNDLRMLDAGGPAVMTLVPSPTNAAIKSVGGSGVPCAPVDQRGLARTEDACDAGAVTLDPTTTTSLASSQPDSVFGSAVTFTATVALSDGGSTVGTGEVSFSVDGTIVTPSVSVAAGTALLTLDTLSAGTHTVVATYVPVDAALIAGSSSVGLTQTVAQSGSTVILSSSANPGLVGDTVTVTATVSAQDADVVPAGTVTLRDTTAGTPGTLVGSPTALVDGVATFDVSALTPGTHSLVASYSGDADNAAAVSAALTQALLVPSAVQSSASATDLEYGRPTTISITVPASGSTVAPTGTVTVTWRGLDHVLALDGTGSASVVATDLALGSSTITVSYAGDDKYAASSATAIPVTVSETSTSTTLALGSDSIAYGVPVALTATVSRTEGAAPAGSVTFYSGATELGTVAVTPGTGSSSTAAFTPAPSQLRVGSPSLTAEFTPGYGYLASTSSASIMAVTKAATTVVASSAASSVPVGATTMLTATVAGSGGSIAVPDGDVEFFDGTTSLGTVTLAGGIATLSHSFSSGGAHAITARYAGSSSFTTRTSLDYTQTVVAEESVTTLTVTPGTSSRYGTTLRFDVDVTGAASGEPGTGSVVVRDGTTVVATITLVDGAGSRTIASPSAGSHAYQATFVPSGTDFSGGTSVVINYTVDAAATSTTLTFSKPSSVHGDPVTLTATVSSADAVPVGSVTFTSRGTTLGTATVVNGVATLATALPQSASFPGGAADVVATFTPSADFIGSSATVGYVVARATTAMTFDLVGVNAGEPQSLVATVRTVTGTGTGSPTGTVTFAGGNGASGTATIVDGVATLTGVTLPAGDRFVQATYFSQDLNFDAPIVNPVTKTVTVGQGTPTVTLATTSTGAIGFGTAVTLTATVATSGVAATGTVRFTATGPAGSSDLGSASLGVAAPGSAALTTTSIPVGTQTITANYLGDGNLVAVTSASITQVVTQAATTTTVTASPTPSIPGQKITLSARVTAPGATVTTGTVQFLVDGVAVGSATVNGSGGASATYVPATSGTLAVEARYTLASGDFAASTGTVTHVVNGRPVSVYLYRINASAAVGEAIGFRVEVSPNPGVEGSPSTLPGGTVTVTDGAGTSCVVTLEPISTPGGVGGTCDVRYVTAGLRTLTASYAGDSLYAGGTSDSVLVSASIRSTVVTLTSPGRWIPGETATLNWKVVGPTTAGTPVTIRDGDTVVCTSSALSGTCDYTIPSDRAEVNLVATYAGTTEWEPQSAILTKTITACVLVRPSNVSPSNGGTVTVESTPNCGPNGFLPGSYVTFRATAADGFTFANWGDSGSTLAILDVLAEGSYIGPTAFFSRPCVEVTFTVVGGTTYGGQEIRSNTAPNCGAGWIRSDYRSQTGAFQVGTVIDLIAAVPTGTLPQKLYGWSGLPADADRTALRQSYTVTSDLSQDVTAIFGVSCVHDIRAVQPTGGTVTLGGTNCYDDLGAGYNLGSSIPVSTKSTGDGYFSSWSGNIRPLTSSATGATATVTVYATNPPVSASYSQCVSFAVTSTGYTYLSGGDGYANGTASVTPTGNCPNKGDGWYLPGSRVSIDTVGERGKTFGGWQSGLPLQAMATTQKNSVTLDTSGTANALW